MRAPSLRLPTFRLPDPIVSELANPRYIPAAFMFAFWVLLLGGAMLVLLPGLLFAQDATVPEAVTDAIGAGAFGFGLSELLKWAIPALGAVFFSASNKVQGLIGQIKSDGLKRVAFIAWTTALMLVGELLNMVVSSDPANWTGAFFEGIAAGGLGAFLVAIGIKQQKAKELAPGTASGFSPRG